ncbi:MAG: hypothetical protein FJ148_20385 [Deltaproteobacteria bacterium]|nr:hypothetical protein [Deltaproteobacteria bacterium]
MSTRLDDDRVASDYGKSRALTLDAIASWQDAIARHLCLRAEPVGERVRGLPRRRPREKTGVLSSESTFSTSTLTS